MVKIDVCKFVKHETSLLKTIFYLQQSSRGFQIEILMSLSTKTFLNEIK